jgi:hypothetical protein
MLIGTLEAITSRDSRYLVNTGEGLDIISLLVGNLVADSG